MPVVVASRAQVVVDSNNPEAQSVFHRLWPAVVLSLGGLLTIGWTAFLIYLVGSIAIQLLMMTL
jgi:hypothetical protein